MIRADRDHRRYLLATNLHRVFAARVEAATYRWINQIRDHARNADQPAATDVLLWHGIDQSACVGMFGILEEFAHRRFFYDAP